MADDYLGHCTVIDRFCRWDTFLPALWRPNFCIQCKGGMTLSSKCLENWKGYFNAFHKGDWPINSEMLQTEIQHSFWIFTSVAHIIEENHNCNMSASDGLILDRFRLVYKQIQCERDVFVYQVYKLYFCCYPTSSTKFYSAFD